MDAILLCVPDRSIAQVARRLARSLKARPLVAHCSGALDLSPLEPLATQGCGVGSLHPLQAVPSPHERLFGFAAIDAPRPKDASLLAKVARSAGLQPLGLPGAPRALYHATAALASNGLVALQEQSAELLERCGAPKRLAREAVTRLMVSALGRDLTGPVARGDASVVAAHLQALRRSAPDVLPLYRALATTQVGLARELGQATAGQLRAILEVLKAPGTGPSPGRRRAPRAGPAPRRPARGRASRGSRSS
ncbi:MAG: DUF2520 domain-containing protein [Deltaproteobacteria bacterium]|nr:DUF2520 domain-containing protein [Deltaproteobacteria bacterium]